MTFSEFLGRFVFVRKCVACRTILGYDGGSNAFCSKCRQKWDSAKVQTCGVCYQSATECTCMPNKLSKAGALCLLKLIFYRKEKMNEPQNKIVYFLKHNKNRRAASFIADELLGGIRREAEVLGIEDIAKEAVIVWVPRTKKARSTEGHDQSELVCHELSKRSGAPSLELILRKRGGKEQKKLNSEERRKNIKNRFSLNKKIECSTDKVVILFDDVVTTGASMAECVTLLKKHGFKSVISVCIAMD